VNGKGYVHVRDAGHSMALAVQHEYEKQEDFKSLMKSVSDVKFREIMREPAYLLPPKMRTVARFMNLSHVIKRAVKMLNAFGKMNVEERKVFSFIPENKPLIEELTTVFKTVNSILQHLKCKGMSEKSADRCLSLLKTLLSSQNQRTVNVGQSMERYIKTELGKLSGVCDRCHISSDIIESVFGFYKA
jgi:hypothetical protein